MVLLRQSVTLQYQPDTGSLIQSPLGSALTQVGSGNPLFNLGGLPLTNPNEPPGLTRFYENPYIVSPALGLFNDNGAAIDGTWWATSGNFASRIDPTAPSGEGVVLGVRMPTNLPTGVGPGNCQEWDTVAENHNTEYTQLYVHWIFKLDGGTDGLYEQHPVLTKIMGFWGSGRNNAGTNASDWYIGIDNNGDTSQPTADGFLQNGWRPVYFNSFFAPSRRDTNLGTGFMIFVDTWYDFEMVQTLDSSPGQGDGRFEMWADGVKIMDHTVGWNSPGSPSGFYGRHNSPTWGGLGTGPRTTTDFFSYDHMYMSGKP